MKVNIIQCVLQIYINFTGTCVVTGHEDGTILVWSQDGVYLDCLGTHLRAVTDIALMSYFCESSLLSLIYTIL
jgi:hypothetical protein